MLCGLKLLWYAVLSCLSRAFIMQEERSDLTKDIKEKRP